MSSITDDAREFLVDWPSYSSATIFEHLTAINVFQLGVQFPQFRSWTDGSQMQVLADGIYEEAYELLGRAGLFRFDQLKRTSSPNSVGVRYEDADNDFILEISTRNELVLLRTGSSMQRFYEWYRRIMPEVHTLYERVRSRLEALSKPADDTTRDITPARAMFVFKFVLHDFTQLARGSATVKNSSLMKAALSKVPSSDGTLTDLNDDQLGDLGRVDVAVSRWVMAPGGDIRELYRAEAPGNLDYGTLWLEFHYIAETRDDMQGKRSQPDFSQFLQRYDHPVSDFLRDRALHGFLADLTDGTAFKATPGLLP